METAHDFDYKKGLRCQRGLQGAGEGIVIDIIVDTEVYMNHHCNQCG